MSEIKENGINESELNKTQKLYMESTWASSNMWEKIALKLDDVLKDKAIKTISLDMIMHPTLNDHTKENLRTAVNFLKERGVKLEFTNKPKNENDSKFINDLDI